jgi:hypothetical protein
MTATFLLLAAHFGFTVLLWNNVAWKLAFATPLAKVFLAIANDCFHAWVFLICEALYFLVHENWCFA